MLDPGGVRVATPGLFVLRRARIQVDHLTGSVRGGRISARAGTGNRRAIQPSIVGDGLREQVGIRDCATLVDILFEQLAGQIVSGIA